jgi:hypothetical protein
MKRHAKGRRSPVRKHASPRPSAPSPRPSAPISPEELRQLRVVHQSLARLTPGLVTHLPTLISHADAYRNAPVRLKRYASTAIVVRIVQYVETTLMNSYNLVGMYLDGIHSGNPISLYAAARGLLEVLATATGVKRAIVAKSGIHEKQFYERVLAVDEVLIRATYGSRDPEFLDAFNQIGGGSKLKAMTKEDLDNLTARNVIGWIKELDQSEYPGAWDMYCRLCEYVHPNIGLNWMYLVLNEADGTVDISRKRPEVMQRAVGNTVEAMLEMAERMLGVCREMPFPFGNTAQYGRRSDGVIPGSLAETVLSERAVPPDIAMLLRDAPRVNADEIGEFYYARSHRETWPVAGLRHGGVNGGPVWIEMNQPSRVVNESHDWSGSLLPSAWGFLLLSISPEEIELAYPQIGRNDIAGAASLRLAAMFAAGTVETSGGKGGQLQRSGLEDLGLWLLPLSSAELLTKPPALLSVRQGRVPEQVMASAYGLLISLLVALVRLGEEHPTMQSGRRYVLTVPHGWDAYADADNKLPDHRT